MTTEPPWVSLPRCKSYWCHSTYSEKTLRRVGCPEEPQGPRGLNFPSPSPSTVLEGCWKELIGSRDGVGRSHVLYGCCQNLTLLGDILPLCLLLQSDRQDNDHWDSGCLMPRSLPLVSSPGTSLSPAQWLPTAWRQPSSLSMCNWMYSVCLGLSRLFIGFLLFVGKGNGKVISSPVGRHF